MLKEIAHGAKGTMIGRAFSFGYGAMGEAGVTKALETIRDVFNTRMMLCGPHNPGEIAGNSMLNPC